MQFKNFIGIVISKLTLDITVVIDGIQTSYQKIKNEEKDIKKYFTSFLKVNAKYKTVTNLFFKYFKQLKINNILFSFKNLNLSVSNQLIVFFYNKFKKFITTIFQRRFHLFIDFLKLTCLFYNNLICSYTYLLIFAQIFKFIAKRLHTQFIAFLKTVFKTLIVDILLLPSSYIAPFKIIGIKFVINGKLQGKTRASSIIIEEGLTPGQSISKKIQFITTPFNEIVRDHQV